MNHGGSGVGGGFVELGGRGKKKSERKGEEENRKIDCHPSKFEGYRNGFGAFWKGMERNYIENSLKEDEFPPLVVWLRQIVFYAISFSQDFIIRVALLVA